MNGRSGPDPLFDAQMGHRPVRSFVLRGGRLTKGQERALRRLWPTYGIPNGESRLDFDGLFGRESPRILEIGFGDGKALVQAALENPNVDFLGIEVYRPGVGSLLISLEEHDLTNVRVLCADAVRVLEKRVPARSFSEVRLFFPDPWPKKRHHKRRIVQPPFVASVYRCLQPGGIFHLATDWEDYAEHMLAVLHDTQFRSLGGPRGFSEGRIDRPRTKFENRGRRKGHGVWDLKLRRPG